MPSDYNGPDRRSENDRLGRIEDKLDKLSDAVVALARVEQQIADLEIRRGEQHVRMNKLSEKIDSIDTHVTELVAKVNFMQKASWVILSIIATAIASQYLIQ